jgi:hypothetical protein
VAGEKEKEKLDKDSNSATKEKGEKESSHSNKPRIFGGLLSKDKKHNASPDTKSASTSTSPVNGQQQPNGPHNPDEKCVIC